MTYRHHHLSSPVKRGLRAFWLVAVIMAIGTVGIHHLEDMPYLDAFYLMSMIATAQGAATVPHTTAGKLFVAFMSFLSVGAVVAALGFVFGPFFGRLWHIGRIKMEDEVQQLTHHKK